MPVFHLMCHTCREVEQRGYVSSMDAVLVGSIERHIHPAEEMGVLKVSSFANLAMAMIEEGYGTYAQVEALSQVGE